MTKNISNKFQSFKNHLLIAMPSLSDLIFEHTVTLLCEHNEEGAMGIVINQPLDFSTVELLAHMDIPASLSQNINPVFAGGPVQVDRGFVVHRAHRLWKSSIKLEQEISITTSSDILHAIGRHEIDDEAFIALGYAGWQAGQLEKEILDNSWLTVAVDADIIFATEVDKRWGKSMQLLGFDANNLTNIVGHA